MYTPPETQRSLARNRGRPRSQRAAVPALERVGAVGERAQQHEEQAEPEDLRARTAAREIDELRQEREEEQRRLGVQRIDDDPVDEGAP